MEKKFSKFLQSAAVIPILTAHLALSPFTGAVTGFPTAADISPDQTRNLSSETSSNNKHDLKVKEEAAKIDAYFAEYDLPLEGYGEKFVKVAEENNLPWSVLPAIAMKESTACLHIIKGTNNCFGWGSGKISFDTVDDSIDTVAKAISGNDENTARYYDGKSLSTVLRIYNGDAVPGYVASVKGIMRQIETQPIATTEIGLNS